MSLTAEEIAMCRDALLEAGVPQRVVTEFVEIRDRIRVVCCERKISNWKLMQNVHVADAIRYMKDTMYMELAQELTEAGVWKVIENQTQDTLNIRIELPVLTPPGWKPPSKVSR